MILNIPGVFKPEELKRVRQAVENSEYGDGRKTAGPRAAPVKHNEQMEKESPGGDQIRKAVIQALHRNGTFKRATYPKLIQSPLISRYVPGMAYGRHIDDALMGRQKKVRTDVSVTIFLSDPAEYDGGELIIYNNEEQQKYKLPAGSAAVYPSGALHRVAEVTRGVRFAAVTWVESFIRDPYKRQILFDLDRGNRWATKQSPDAYEVALLNKAHSNLVRMWSDT